MLGVVLAAAVVAGSPPPAATPTATARAASDAAPKDPDPLICHSEAGSGTRLVHKVCFRESELAQRRLDDRQAMDRMKTAWRPAATDMGPMGPRR